LRTPRPTHLAALPAALPISDGATHGRRRVPPTDVDGCDPRSLEGTTHARHRVQPADVDGCDPRSPEGPTRRHRRGQTPTRHTGADAPVFLSWTRSPTSTLTRRPSMTRKLRNELRFLRLYVVFSVPVLAL